MNKADIKTKITNLLAQENQIRTVFIYGSFSLSEEFNDIDIALFLNSNIEESFSYEGKIEYLLEQELSMKVDVRVANSAPERFLYEVFKGECLLDKDDNISVLIEKIAITQMDEEYYKRQFLKELIDA